MTNPQLQALSDRQKECLRLVVTGRGAKQIAAVLGIAPGTVEQHLKAARRILGQSDSGAAGRMLVEHETVGIQQLDTHTPRLAQSRQEASYAPATEAGWTEQPRVEEAVGETRIPFEYGLPTSHDGARTLSPEREGVNDLDTSSRAVLIAKLTILMVLAIILAAGGLMLLNIYLHDLSRNGG